MLCLVKHTLKAIYQQSAGFSRPSCSTLTEVPGLESSIAPLRCLGVAQGDFQKDRGTWHPTKGETPGRMTAEGRGACLSGVHRPTLGSKGCQAQGEQPQASPCLGSYSNTNAAVRWMNEHIGRIC